MTNKQYEIYYNNVFDKIMQDPKYKQIRLRREELQEKFN